MNQELSIKCEGVAFETNMLSRTIYVAPCHVPEALGAILEAMEAMADSSTLCQALADHPDFCELAARVACVKSLRSELADRDLTATERDTLDRLAADPCDWISAEAKGALDDLADGKRLRLNGRDCVHLSPPSFASARSSRATWAIVAPMT